MKAIRFVFCLFAALMLTTLNGLAAEEEDFKTFLQKFTSSASFQYSRIKFPLKSPIALLKDDGETEQTFPFTREKWALLDEETLKEGRTTEEEGGTYISHFTVNEPAHKEFEAGYDESEPSLRVVFELTDGKWYVTDCYNDWYNFDLPINELEETIQAVRRQEAPISIPGRTHKRSCIKRSCNRIFQCISTVQRNPSFWKKRGINRTEEG